MRKLSLLLTGALVALSGCCSTAHVEDYSGRGPEMDIREYLKGRVEASGVFLDRSNMVDKQFHVTLKGTWNGDDGKLDERFVFSDGHKEARVWSVHFTDDHHFTATAHDVVGVAHGAQFGNAVNMRYILRVPVKDTTYDVAMNDWMYRTDEHTVLNHTTMHKLGFKVGELFLTFDKK